MRQHSRASSVLVGFFLTIGGLALMVMMVYVVGNCIGRALFRIPIMGTIEIAGMAGAIVVSVAVAFAEREKSNVVVDIVTESLPSRSRSILDALMLLLSLGAVAFLLYAVIGSGITSFVAKETTLTTGIPIGPFKLAWAAGLFASWLFLLKYFIDAVRRTVKG
jgi:TRAP-type C4-dicarboxylate transport system permease small subunit